MANPEALLATDTADADDAADEFTDYLLEIGGTLVIYGCPAYRLEDVIRTVAATKGYEAQAFALPTGLFVSLAGPGLRRPVVRMARVKEWGVDLDRLTRVDTIFNDVLEDRCTILVARQRLREVQASAPRYPRALQWLATAIVSGAAAVFFRGGFAEIILASLAGATVGILGWALNRNPSGRFLVEFLGGLVSALLAWGFTRHDPSLSREVLVLSGVITLVPGMTLTTGLAELARKSLVAGAARLMEAFAALLLIIFGIALAIGAEQIVGAPLVAPAVERAGLGLPFQIAAVLAASLSFAVLFSVPRNFMWAAMVSAALGWATTGLGQRLPGHLPGYVVAFGAALAICLYSNLCARFTQRPAQLFQLPGMTLLVPGSFGYLSLESFLRGQTVDGVSKAFTMMLVAGALVTGVLLANVLFPAKKLL